MPIATKIDLNQCGVAIKVLQAHARGDCAQHNPTARRRLTNVAAAHSGKA